jgi:ABC-type uncharacterized transport system substrate-binding protein
MEARYELVLNQRGLTGFWVEWSFDQYFTGSIMMDYDRDGDGNFDAAETRDVRQNAFSNLANFDYFTFVGTDGGHIGVESVTRFQPRFESQTLIYRFFVPYEIPLAELSRLVLAAYDPTFFCAISYDPDEPVRIAGSPAPRINVRRRENPDVEIEYLAGDTQPTTTTVQELVIELSFQ